MKKHTYIVLMLSTFILLAFALLMWTSGRDAILQERAMLSVTLISVFGLYMVYSFQQRGVLNFKIVHVFLLLCALSVLMVSILFLRAEIQAYNRRVAKIETLHQGKEKALPPKNEMIIYRRFKEQKNLLLGYEHFLTELIQNYKPADFSYANTLKEAILVKLSNQKGTQNYWNEIINGAFRLDTASHTYQIKGYDIIYNIGHNRVYVEDLGNTTNKAYIKHVAVREYCQRATLNFDRTPEHISSFWHNNKVFLYTFFSKSKYDKLCKQLVDDLIQIKDSVNKQPNYKEFYDRYNISDAEFLNFPDPKFVASFKYSWPFSFWDRRYHEGNDELVYTILKEVQQHYKD